MKHITYEERKRIAELIKSDYNVREIADIIGKSYQTIYREIKRGNIGTLNNEYVYSPEVAQGRYAMQLKRKGKKVTLKAE